MIVPASEEAIAEAAEIIRRGGLVAFPTETVYGLGANALDQAAVARIYEAKERPFASPLIVHVADEAMARALTTEWSDMARALAAKFWPGPLTLVMKKAAVVPDLVTGGLDSVGIRIPNHTVALALIKAAALPIAAPSANRFTAVSPTTAQHVADGLGQRVDLILDGGPAMVGIESTVVSLRRSPPAILRPGTISQAELEKFTGVAWQREMDRPHVMEAPGLHPKHYSPRTPLYLLEQGLQPAQGRGKILQMPKHADEYAQRLYAELHQADNEGWDWIGVERPPNTAEWAAIHDRLTRASREE